MKSSEETVVEFVHSADARLTAGERIHLYRSFASTTNSEELAKHFFECADDLTAAEQKVGQLLLNFKRRARG